MEQNVKISQLIVVKPSHRADLGGDPAQGTIIEIPHPRKVKVLWSNGQIGTHAVNSPYMWRFEVRAI